MIIVRRVSRALGSIGTGQGNKEKQIVLGGRELPKTLCTDWGWVKKRSATLSHKTGIVWHI